MKRNILNILSLSVAFVLALASCSEKPLVKSEIDAKYAANQSNLATATVEVTLDEKGQTATFVGTVSSSVEITESGFQYSTDENFNIDASKFIRVDSTYMEASVKLSHLTTYYVRAYGVVADGIAYSAPATITTLDLPESEKVQWIPVSTKSLFKENIINIAFGTPESTYNVYVEKRSDKNVYRIANLFSEYVSSKGVTYSHPLYGSDILEEELVTKETTWFIIDLDGTYSTQKDPSYTIEPGQVYVPINTLNFDWGYGEMMAASIAYNLSTSAGPVMPDNPSYPLGTYDEAKKCINLGTIGLYLPANGWYISKTNSLLYLDEKLMIEDYNADFEYKMMYKGMVSSQAFGPKADSSLVWSDQVLSVSKTDDNLFYLNDYFVEGYGLAFRVAEDSLYAGVKIEDVNNEQFSGINIFGQDIYFSVKNGKVLSVNAETGFPTLTVKIKIYSKDAEGNVVTEYGDFEETFVATSAEEIYTADDLYGAYKEDYVGLYSASAKLMSEDFSDRYEFPLLIEDAGQDANGNELLTIKNLSTYYGFGNTFNDAIYAVWKNGAIYVQPQQTATPFSYKDIDYAIGCYPYSSETGYFYSDVQVLGAFTEEGKLAFVSPYSDLNVNGFVFYDSDNQFLLDGLIEVFGPKAEGTATINKSFKVSTVKAPASDSFRAPLDPAKGIVSPSTRPASVVPAKVEKTFNPENGKVSVEYNGPFNKNPFTSQGLYFFF